VSICTDVELRAEIDALREAQREDRRRIEALEALERDRGGARDLADVALVEHFARLGRTFMTAGVFKHREFDAELADLLVRADVDSPKQLGKLLRRISRSIDVGIAVRRVSTGRDGIVWRCEFASLVPETRAR
jgi:hypothetical protein